MDIITSISSELADSLNELKSNINNNNDGLKDKIIKLIASKINLKFIDDITIEEEIFKKEELNKILDILFFIKKFGKYNNIEK